MSYELGLVRVLGVEALGEPGQRRFRLFVGGAEASAFVWLEKEQLNSLSLALDRALAILSDGQILRIEAQSGAPLAPTTRPATFTDRVDYDLQAGQMSLSFDEDENAFVIHAVPVEMVNGEMDELIGVLHEEETLAFSFALVQGQRLAQDITLVVASGRPVCPLCQQPLDGGPHACVKQNGHSKAVLHDITESDEG